MRCKVMWAFATVACLAVVALIAAVCYRGAPRKERRTQAVIDLQDAFAVLKPGKFTMEPPGYVTDSRVEVEITHPVRIMKKLVTQALWKQVMGTEPWLEARIKEKDPEALRVGPNIPAVGMNWYQAHEFAEKLGKLAGCYLRLPTEAEWEYAVRAGTKTEFFWGEDSEKRFEYCWGYESGKDTFLRDVGLLKPNPAGLYDTAGLVWQWTADLCHADPENGFRIAADHYPKKAQNFCGMSGHVTIIRGDGRSATESGVRSSSKKMAALGVGAPWIGLRLVRDDERVLDVKDLKVVEPRVPEASSPLSDFEYELDELESREARVARSEQFLEDMNALKKQAKDSQAAKDVVAEIRSSGKLPDLIETLEAIREIFIEDGEPKELANRLKHVILALKKW